MTSSILVVWTLTASTAGAGGKIEKAAGAAHKPVRVDQSMTYLTCVHFGPLKLVSGPCQEYMVTELQR